MSRSLASVFLLVLLVTLDQISKFVVIEWGLGFYKNYGFFFGLINFGNPLISVLIAGVISILATLNLLQHLNKRHSGLYPESRTTGSGCRVLARHDILIVGSVLFLAGSVSNLIDRMTRGYVVDFLDWKTLLSFWPTGFVRYFNLADVFIVVGLVIIGIRFTRRGQKAEN